MIGFVVVTSLGQGGCVAIRLKIVGFSVVVVVDEVVVVLAVFGTLCICLGSIVVSSAQIVSTKNIAMIARDSLI